MEYANPIIADLFNTIKKYKELLDDQAEYASEFSKWVAELNETELSALFKNFQPWFSYYEKGLDQASKELWEFGNISNLSERFDKNTPHSSLVQLAEQAKPDIPDNKIEALKVFSPLIAPMYANLYNIKAMSFYSLPINELVKIGTPEAMLAAVSIDPTAVSCKPFQHLMSVAITLGAEEFLAEYRTRLAGPKKRKLLQKNVRLMDALLEESFAAAGEHFANADATSFLIDELGIYHTDEDPVGSLNRLRRKWAKERKEPKP